MKFCKKCNSLTERKANGDCKLCAKTYAAAYHIANRAKLNAARAEWSAANPERAKATAAAYRAKNAEKAKAYKAAWCAANSSQAKEVRKAWRSANQQIIRIYEQNRRARKRLNGGTLSLDLSSKLFVIQKGKCACCKLPLGEDYQLDHIMPIALGGANTDDNIQLLRQKCNNQKSAKHPIDFMRERGFLL